MLTGTALINELVDELNELKLSTMAATLDDLYHKPGFLEMDRLTLIAELIGPQFQEKINTTLKNRLTAAHLKGSPEELSDCVDSDKREYLPAGITEVLSSFDFIERGYNVCILWRFSFRYAVYGIQRSPFCFRTAIFRHQRPPIF